MINKTFVLKEEGSEEYAKLITYIYDDTDALAISKRPLVIVCPGGGYAYTSDREAEPMALTLMAMGYNAAVLRYSTAPAKYPTALLELARSILIIKENAKEWHVDADNILVQGSSAGAHLAASMGCMWNDPEIYEALGLSKLTCDAIRPAGMILAYPVITSGEFAHRGSFENLLGDKEKELSEAMSLENRVTKDSPKAFVWHTFEDQSVPLENSLLFVSAMRKVGIPMEYHIFPQGSHGLGLANNLTLGHSGKELSKGAKAWTGLLKTWLEENYPITLEL